MENDTLIKTVNLSCGYNNSIVLNNINLDIYTEDKIILRGENGSGKTTFLKTIIGIIKPVKGQIIKKNNINISYFKQNYPNPNFPISAKEIVSMGIYSKNSYSKKKAEKLIDEALEKTNTLHLKNQPFYSLSGGEKQRISLARCLCQNADILILDEPSSFLDRNSKLNFMNLIKNLSIDKTNKKNAIILASHDIELISTLNWKTLRVEAWKD